MNFKMAIGAAVSSIMMASAAAAATLSISGGDYGALTANHDPDYSALPAWLVPNVTGDVARFGYQYADFDGSTGLQISDPSMVKITYLGKEAAASNTVMNVAGLTLNNKSSAVGDYILGTDLPQFINLTFSTLKNAVTYSIENGLAGQDFGAGGAGEFLSMAFYLEDDKNALAFFGDGRGDSDFDDMVVRISVVPLPAGGVLLLTALGGMAVARRRKKAA